MNRNKLVTNSQYRPSIHIANIDMESILRELGYPQTVVDRFHGEGVTPEAVSSLAVNQLDDLGIIGMGRHAILRGRCRVFVSNNRSTLASSDQPGPSRRAYAETRQLFAPYGGHKKKKKVQNLSLNILCLSQSSTTHVPSTLTQRCLQDGGLGEKKVVIPADASPHDVMEVMFTTFPKLRDAGGFEYLKAEGSSKLLNEVVLPLDGGFSAVNLKSIAKQSRIYIRPIQQNLNLSPSTNQENSEEHELLLECNRCKEKIAQTKLRQHISSCQNEGDGEDRSIATPTQPSSSPTPTEPDHNYSTNRLSSTQRTISAESSTVRRQRSTSNVATIVPAPPVPLPPVPATASPRPLNPASLSSNTTVTQLPASSDSNLDVTHCNQPLVTPDEGEHTSSIEDIVQRLENQVNENHPSNVINVSRYNLLRQAHKAFKKDSFEDTAPLSIRFTGEDGIDNGGLSREFMSIAMQGLAEQSIFCGEVGKDLVLDFAAINNRTYYTTGRMMAYFLVHRGPAPCLMNDHLYQLLIDPSSIIEKLTINDVKDADVKENIMKIVQASEAEYDDTISQLLDFIQMAGCSNLAFDFRKRPVLVKYLIRFFAVDRLSPAVEQFKEGLSTLGVLEEMRKFPRLLCKAMTPSDEMKITAQNVIDMFEVEWSEAGSNRHRKEAITHVYFLDLLDSLEGEGKLEDLFSWATGLKRFPVIGFRVKPKLFFDHPEDMVDPDEVLRRGLPFANTCALTLRLPVLESEEEFMQNMRSSISFRIFTSS